MFYGILLALTLNISSVKAVAGWSYENKYSVYLRYYNESKKDETIAVLEECLDITEETATTLLDEVPKTCLGEQMSRDESTLLVKKLSSVDAVTTTTLDSLGEFNNTYIMIFLSGTNNMMSAIRGVNQVTGLSLRASKSIADNPGSIVMQTDSEDEMNSAISTIGKTSAAVRVIKPIKSRILQKGVIALNTKGTSKTVELIEDFSGLSSGEAKEVYDSIPNAYILENISESVANEIIYRFKSSSSAQAVFIPAYEVRLTDFGENESDILSLILEANMIESGDTTVIEKIKENFQTLPATALSNTDYDSILELKNAIEQLGGKANIINACYITKVNDEDGNISVSDVIMKKRNLDIILENDIRNENIIFVNGVNVSDKFVYNNIKNKLLYTVKNVIRDYKIEVVPKEKVEVLGLDDTLSFIYNGQPHDLTELVSFSNENITLDDWNIHYENKDTGDVYEVDNPPINAGSYIMYFELGIKSVYSGYFEYNFKIDQKDLTIKPKDIEIYRKETPDFELIYDGIVSGDTLDAIDEIKFYVYSGDLASEQLEQITLEDAIEKVGEYYVKIGNEDMENPFDEDGNYNIFLDYGILSVIARETSGPSGVLKRGVIAIRSTKKKVQTVKLIKELLGLSLRDAKNLADAIPNTYILENITEESSVEIINRFKDEAETETEFIPAYEVWLEDFEENESGILDLILKANLVDSGDTKLVERTEGDFDILPALALSNTDFDVILELKNAIEQLGGKAEIRNACYITKINEDKENISVPNVVMKKRDLNIILENDIRDENKIYVSGEDISDNFIYDDTKNKLVYIIRGIQENYTIEIVPKEKIEVLGLDDSLVFTYNGQPHDLTELVSFSNENFTLDDWYIYYENEDTGDTYEIDEPPIDAGSYVMYFELNDTTEYCGYFEYYFTIDKKDLIVKPKDVKVSLKEMPNFELIYDGIISGDTIEIVDEMNFYIYSGDLGPKQSEQITLEDAINNPGEYYVKIGNEDMESPFDEDGNYNIILDYGILTVKEKESTGGSSVTRYTIKVIENPNVIMTPSGNVRVKRGRNQTFKIEVKDGYKIKDVLVDNVSIGVVSEYTFEKVKSNHTIEVITEEKDAGSNDEETYIDVKKNHWFYDAVEYATENGLMNGTGERKFSPNLGTTRGMIITILYRLENSPEIKVTSTFDDVKKNMWYSDAVAWGEEHNIILGYGDGTFGVDDNITREQLAAIMYRYSNYKKYDVSAGEDTNILSYNDISELSEYAVPSMQWACGESLVSGIGNNLLAPRGNATRAQVAMILMRYCEKYMK